MVMPFAFALGVVSRQKKSLVVVSARAQMAWERLHTGNWKDVTLAWRDAYALACILVALPAAALDYFPCPAAPAAAGASAVDACSVGPAELVASEPPGSAGEGSQAKHMHACPPPEPGAEGDLAALHAYAMQQRAGSRAGGPDLALAPAALAEWEGRARAAREGTGAALRDLDLGAMMGGGLFRPWLDRAIEVLLGQHLRLAWLLEWVQQQQQQQQHREQDSSDQDRTGECRLGIVDLELPHCPWPEVGDEA